MSASDVHQLTKSSLFLGPYRSGKTSEAIRHIVRLKKESQISSILIVVPSARYRRLLENRIAATLQEEGGEGLFNLNIRSFYDTCADILKVQGKHANTIADELRSLILGSALEKLRAQKKLSHFSALAKFSGTAPLLLELLDEFQKAGYTPASLKDKLSACLSDHSRFIELADIYSAYWSELDERKLYDTKKLALEARSLLYSSFLPQLEYDLLLMDGFDRISPLQADLFKGLSLRAKEFLLTFDYVAPQWQEFCQTEPYHWKESSWLELAAYFPENQTKHTYFTPAGKQHTVSIHYYLDRYLEMDGIARQCRQLLEQDEDPVKAHEILVVVRNLDTYEPAIRVAFEENNVPYFIDGSAPASTLPVVQFFKKLFSLSTAQMRRQDVMQVLRSPYFNQETIGLTESEIARLDRESYRQNLVGSLNGWRNFLQNSPLNTLSSALIRFLIDMTPPKESCSYLKHISWIEDRIEAYLIQLPSLAAERNTIAFEMEKEGLRSIRKALKMLLQKESLLQLPPCSWEDCFNQLIGLLDGINYARHRSQKPSIVICTAEIAPNRSFKHVLIAGVVEGDYPRSYTPSGFLSQEERRQWQNLGINLFDARFHPDFENALFTALIERATSSLRISYPQFEMSGEELLPSFFLAEHPLFKDCQHTGHEPHIAVPPMHARDLLRSTLWHHNYFQALELSTYSPTLRALQDQMAPAISALLARRQGKLDLYSGNLQDFVQTQATTIPSSNTWTASRLNDYGVCPFRYWLNHVLNLKQRKEPELGLTPQLRGQLYHKILEQLVTRLLPLLPSVEENILDRELDEALQESFLWLHQQPGFQPTDYWIQEQKDIRYRIRRFVQKQLEALAKDPKQYTPALLEVSFGEGKQFPPLVIKDTTSTITLRGTIDRIDLPRPHINKFNSTGKNIEKLPESPELSAAALTARVIDYKTGAQTISEDKAFSGINMQLPIYALAVERSILPGSKVEGGSYLSLTQAKTAGNLYLETPEKRELLSLTENYIKQYVHAIGKGDFSLSPKDKQACLSCEHRRVCAIQELPSVGRDNDE